MVRLTDLPTPSLIFDLERLEVNATRMRDRCRRLGVRLRPHVKTTKCVEAARIQHDRATGPVTVSTLAEAHAFAAAGFDDLTYAVPAAPSTADDLARLSTDVPILRVDVDHPETVSVLESAARRHGTRIDVMLEVDCGDHRCGVDPRSGDAVELARRVARSSSLHLAGILTHGGQSYRSRSPSEAARIADVERDTMVAFAARLRRAGLEVEEISIGSTPTVITASHLDGVTEVRPGNYVVFDAFQAAIGSCTLDDTACWVVTEVRGVYPDRRELVVDAGALALSMDTGPRHVNPDCGFGVPCDLASGRPLPGLAVIKLSQEHGVLRSDGRFDVSCLSPGDRLRILPNHSCLAIACHELVHIIRDASAVDSWRPVRGW